MLTGLDRLLAESPKLAGRRYGLLAHQAAVSSRGEPAHWALVGSGYPPRVLFAPEHGYYSVEQDMVPALDAVDLTGLPIRSLYGESVDTLRPHPTAFSELDLLVIDLQDIGTRYYTYAATAVWAAEVALSSGLEVWILDRPNPLGGRVVEGNLREPGYESFVGAFEIPVRHGMTLGELARLVLGDPERLEIWKLEGWQRSFLWNEIDLPWVAPSPNMPTFETEVLYPGLCLVEGTTVSEGRGTTRPFHLVGAPWIDAKRLTERVATALSEARLGGVRCIPTFFRPQFQKHAGEVCAGIELMVTRPASVSGYRLGIEVIRGLFDEARDANVDLWRTEVYEFVEDRPAIDLLAGTNRLRLALEAGASGRADLEVWIGEWESEQTRFEQIREPFLLYQ